MAPVYADHPYALIPTPVAQLKDGEEKDLFLECASEMALVHNMAIRGLNSIYLQAPHIQAADFKPFAHYIVGWYNLLHVHHSEEEAEFFPDVEKMTGEKGIMDANVEQHHAFHDGMEALNAYALAVISGTKQYDGVKVVSLIDAFGPTLVEHLSDEIPTLVGLRRFGTEKMKELPKLFEHEAQKNMSKIGLISGLPWCFANLDFEYEDGRWKNWPPAPWFILFFVKNVAWWLHADWWKFGACGRSGTMQPLYAIPDKS